MAISDIFATPVKWFLTAVVLPVGIVGGAVLAGWALLKGGEKAVDGVKATSPEAAASAGARHMDGALDVGSKALDYFGGAATSVYKRGEQNLPELMKKLPEFPKKSGAQEGQGGAFVTPSPASVTPAPQISPNFDDKAKQDKEVYLAVCSKGKAALKDYPVLTAACEKDGLFPSQP